VKLLEEEKDGEPDDGVVRESVEPYMARLIRSTRFTVRCG
jgi:hypothetical protein